MKNIIISFLLYNIMLLAACSKDDPNTNILKEMNLSSKKCKIVEIRKNIAQIDCGAEVDGPLYYVNIKKSKLIMCCGGCCESDRQSRKGTQCSECPPKEWIKH